MLEICNLYTKHNDELIKHTIYLNKENLLVLRSVNIDVDYNKFILIKICENLKEIINNINLFNDCVNIFPINEYTRWCSVKEDSLFNTFDDCIKIMKYEINIYQRNLKIKKLLHE